MSVDIIQPFSSAPRKRAHETISLANDGASKCAEIFVTNNADKWTFFCAYCQKATIDIGAFICHIRLEHLNIHTDLTEGNQTPEPQSNVSTNKAASLSNVSNLTQNADAEIELVEDAPHPTAQNILTIKEELTMANNRENLPTFCSEKETLIANKNSTATSSQSCKEKLNEEFFAITAIGQNSEHQEEHKEIVQIVFLNDGKANEKNKNNSNHERNKDNNKSTDNNLEAMSSNVPTGEVNDNVNDGTDSNHKCSFCNQNFKTIHNLKYHITTRHRHDLKTHSILHSRDIRLSYPVCAERYKKKHFVAHARMHESNRCLPCQECGKVFSNPKLLMKHWKKHEKEKPYSCKICSRRFLKKPYLTNHLKSHNQYHCNFCAAEFNAHGFQRAPYVCAKCEKLSGIKQKVEHIRYSKSLNDSNPIFGSVELGLKHGEELASSINQGTAATNELFKNSGSTFNNDSNTSSYAVGQDSEAQEKHKEIVQVVYLNDEAANETNEYNIKDEQNKDTDKNNDNNSEAMSPNVPAANVFDEVNDGTESHKQYECSLCSSVYNTPETQRSPYVCGICENLHGVLLPEVTIASANTADLTGEIQTNTEDITNYTTNMPGSFNNSNANTNDDDCLNDCDSDLEFIDEWHNDNLPSGSSSASNAPQTITTPKEGNKKMHKCQYCHREFISERSLVCHTSKMHVKNKQFHNRYKCHYCNITFKTNSGLGMHQKTHDKNNQFHCPVCPTTEFRESTFLTHVLLHENESCFPCQVCAKIFSSNAQRLEHWRTHIEERPHGCKFCYRRFYKTNVLKNHMKSHGQYYCHFCANIFHSSQTQHHPYACTQCKKLPEVKRKLEKHGSLANKKH